MSIMVVLLSEIYLRVYLGIGELYFLGDSKLIKDIKKSLTVGNVCLWLIMFAYSKKICEMFSK